jgi:hypothetical protein
MRMLASTVTRSDCVWGLCPYSPRSLAPARSRSLAASCWKYAASRSRWAASSSGVISQKNAERSRGSSRREWSASVAVSQRRTSATPASVAR